MTTNSHPCGRTSGPGSSSLWTNVRTRLLVAAGKLVVEVKPLAERLCLSVTAVSKPTVGSTGGSTATPVLRRSATFAGTPNPTVLIKAACRMPDGRVYSGNCTINGKKYRSTAAGSIVDYEIELYDANTVDLAKATCYASA